jgi:hypothetical protein
VVVSGDEMVVEDELDPEVEFVDLLVPARSKKK